MSGFHFVLSFIFHQNLVIGKEKIFDYRAIKLEMTLYFIDSTSLDIRKLSIKIIPIIIAIGKRQNPS